MQMKKITIHTMTPDDINEVYEIESLVHPGHHWSKDAFYNELSNKLAHYYCLRDEGNKLAGYIGFWQIFEEAHITTLAVHPDYRRIQLSGNQFI